MEDTLLASMDSVSEVQSTRQKAMRKGTFIFIPQAYEFTAGEIVVLFVFVILFWEDFSPTPHLTLSSGTKYYTTCFVATHDPE